MNRDCEWTRSEAAELALGIADGETRARALEHLAGCDDCRAYLDRISGIADELTLLAPSEEPPAGFEARVVGGMRPQPERRGWLSRRRFLAPAAAALAGAAIAAVGVWLALGNDRDLANSYRDTLAVANGEYFDAASLERPGGAWAGYVYGYQGKASWVVAIVNDGVEPGRYRLQLVADNGERAPLRQITVGSDGHGSAGGVTPIDYEKLAELRLLDDRGREVAESSLD